MFKRALHRTVDVRDGAVAALFWSFVYHFCLMAGYYILQPLRDEMGLAGGGGELPELFIASMVLMLAANPVFSLLVTLLPRGQLIPMVYRFFMVNLVIFYLLLHGTTGASQVPVAQAFFLWVGIFNLFAVSVFWAFLADLFTSDQGKRLFGFIGAGGTFGQLIGSGATAQLAHQLGPVNLLLLSVVLLEGSVYSVRQLGRLFPPEGKTSSPIEAQAPAGQPKPSSGSAALEGIQLILKSPYLLGICLFMFLYTFTSSFLYFGKASVVGASILDSAARTAFFAKMNLIVGFLTVGLQLFLTGRLMASVGVSLALGLVPLITAGGFALLGFFPVLIVFASFDVLRKTANYAVARPAREVLYTVLSRQEKYKSKSFIDTFIYRGGDALAAAAFAVLTRQFKLGFSGIAFAAVPFALLWLAIALLLGSRQKEMASKKLALAAAG